MWHRMLANGSVKDGFIDVVQGPGFGLQLDAAVRQYRIDCGDDQERQPQYVDPRGQSMGESPVSGMYRG